MTINLGMVRPGSTILVPFNTYDSNDPSASVAIAAFVLADIGIYKGTSMTERASTTGVVLLDTDGIDIDGAVGIGGFSIDLSSNATAAFYSSGSNYYVTVGPATVDAAIVNYVAATFSIGYPNAIINTTVASVTSQTQFILTDGPAEADALIGCKLLFHDVASAVQVAYAYVTDYAVTTKEVTCTDPVGFTFVATDNVSVFLPDNVHAVQGTTQTAGDLAALIVAADVVVDAIKVVTDKFAFTTANQVDSQPISMAANVITATAINADAITAAKVAADVHAEAADAVWDEAMAGHVAAGTAGLALQYGAIITDTTVAGTPTSTTIELTSGVAVDDFYNDQVIFIVSGTGIGQSRVVQSYDGTTKIITIDEAFAVTPDAADRVVVLLTHVHAISQIAAAVWDEPLTGASHNLATSAGKRLRQLQESFVVAEGTAEAGTSTTITLEDGAVSTTNDIYRGDRIIITAGTGVSEHGIVVSYVGSTRVATMAETWVTTPDTDSVYEIVPASADIETWQHVVVTNGNGAPDVNIASTDDIDLSATQKASVNAEVDTALNTAIPGSPTADSINERLAAIDDLIQAAGDGDAAAILVAAAAIKVVTDKFAFTTANQVDANTLAINSATVVGDGNATPWDGA